MLSSHLDAAKRRVALQASLIGDLVTNPASNLAGVGTGHASTALFDSISNSQFSDASQASP
eukprot:6870511-Karenia_brevis.AAC.1